MASLVNYVRKICQPGEITWNISWAWCRHGGFFAKVVQFESNWRNVWTCYVNS